MNVTEETAKGRKCCVFAQACAASRCMGWRWAVEPVAPTDTEAAVEGLGYCGRVGVLELVDIGAPDVEPVEPEAT